MKKPNVYATFISIKRKSYYLHMHVRSFLFQTWVLNAILPILRSQNHISTTVHATEI